jgi:hypothetical protein
MVGREDPDGETPYAIIITREADFNQDGIPDRRSAVTQTCDPAVYNDCYVAGKRHVIFENLNPPAKNSYVHGWADFNIDGMQPSDALAWGETIPDWSDTTFPEGAPHDAICQMCHSQTSNNGCGFNWSSEQECSLHNQNRQCTDCHIHADCFDNNGTCDAAWTLPNRDIRMDSVTTPDTDVNSGTTVVLTADFTNLGDATEVVKVKFYSSIDNYLGFTEVSGVPPSGGTGQALFNWITTTNGSHTVSAEAQPVLAEINVANNTATFGTPVVVSTVDIHDIAVDSVSLPSPIQQGDSVTVTITVSNPGTFTEPAFPVTLTSDLDGSIGTLSAPSLAPSASADVDFTWNTTGATLGTHVLTGTHSATGDENATNDSATTGAVVAVHDVAVTAVTASPQVEVDTSTTVSVDIANEGGFTETFNVTLTSNEASDGNLPLVLSSGALAGGASTTLDFTWDTTGAAEAVHTLTATADTVTGETDTADNSASTTSEVIPPTTHDVAVDSVTAAATILQGTSASVDVEISNNGGATETFNVTLVSDVDGTIQVLSSGALGAGNTTTLNFTWNTDVSTTPGLHTLTATADTVAGETNTGDNSANTTTTVQWHDVEAVSVTAPASTTEGDTAAVDVVVRNNGDFSETFNVTLTSDQSSDGDLPLVLSSGALGAGGQTTLNFSWDTTGATIATHTLTASAATVTGELDTTNNSASTTAEVASAAVTHDVAVTLVSAPATADRPNTGTLGVTVSVTVENQGTVEETFDVTLDTDQTGTGDLPQTQPVTLSAGGSTVIDFTWNIAKSTTTKAVHTLTATAATVSGEVDTADNSSSTTIDIT